METNLSHESYLQRQELRSIIREIVLLSYPEKILLLSASFEYLITETIYFKNALHELRSKHYHLLILYNTKKNNPLAKYELMLFNHFKDRRNLQFQVWDIYSFNEDLKSGNEQANHILANAMLWYDKEQVPLECPKEGFN